FPLFAVRVDLPIGILDIPFHFLGGTVPEQPREGGVDAEDPAGYGGLVNPLSGMVEQAAVLFFGADGN
ncbi:MAG: hypothetical protein MUF17_06400, partial [Syntrophales bacterium]|nr:hypothetical protein [Syntrophales bacterium]